MILKALLGSYLVPNTFIHILGLEPTSVGCGQEITSIHPCRSTLANSRFVQVRKKPKQE
jgi:hypothetical protein